MTRATSSLSRDWRQGEEGPGLARLTLSNASPRPGDRTAAATRSSGGDSGNGRLASTCPGGGEQAPQEGARIHLYGAAGNFSNSRREASGGSRGEQPGNLDWAAPLPHWVSAARERRAERAEAAPGLKESRWGPLEPACGFGDARSPEARQAARATRACHRPPREPCESWAVSWWCIIPPMCQATRPARQGQRSPQSKPGRRP